MRTFQQFHDYAHLLVNMMRSVGLEVCQVPGNLELWPSDIKMASQITLHGKSLYQIWTFYDDPNYSSYNPDEIGGRT